MIRVEAWPDGRRVYLHTPFGRLRVHHGITGLLLTITGTALVLHDWRDRWWMHDR